MHRRRRRTEMLPWLHVFVHCCISTTEKHCYFEFKTFQTWPIWIPSVQSCFAAILFRLHTTLDRLSSNLVSLLKLALRVTTPLAPLGPIRTSSTSTPALLGSWPLLLIRLFCPFFPPDVAVSHFHHSCPPPPLCQPGWFARGCLPRWDPRSNSAPPPLPFFWLRWHLFTSVMWKWENRKNVCSIVSPPRTCHLPKNKCPHEKMLYTEDKYLFDIKQMHCAVTGHYWATLPRRMLASRWRWQILMLTYMLMLLNRDWPHKQLWDDRNYK